MLKKILKFTVLVFLSSTILVSCSDTNDSQKEINKNKGETIRADKDLSEIVDNKLEEEKSSSNKDLNSIDNKKLDLYFDDNKSFFINSNNKIIYNGYCEYGHTLEKVQINKKDYNLLYKGKMTDGYGEDERGERNFEINYNFKLDEGGNPMAYERVRNLDYMSKNKDTLNSIIKNYIVIWGNPNEGKSWEQKVIYKDKEYKAKTTMKDVSKNKYTLITTISNIEGFYKNTYKEERTYKIDKGLISFSNTPNYEVESIEDGSELIFGYNINIENS